MKHPGVLCAIAMLGVTTIAGAFFPLSGGFDLSWRTIDGGGADIINVPSDQPTIQEGINAACQPDTCHRRP